MKPASGKLTFRVINNSAAVMVGQLIYKIISFFTGLLIIRALSGEAYGQYSFIYVYLSFFDVFVQFGMNAILVKRISQTPEKASLILGNALLLRGALSAVMFPAAYFLVGLLGYPLTIQQGVLLAGFQLFLTLRSVYETIFRIHFKMIYSSLWIIAKGILQFGLVVAAVVLKPELMTFIAIGLISGFVTLAGFALHSRKFVRMDLRPDFELLKSLMGESFPLLLSGYMTLIYYRIDVFMLSKMTSFADVGYYSVAVRLTESLDMLSSALLVSVFPILARTFKESRVDFDRTISKAMRVLLLTAMPMVAGGTIVARDLLDFLFGSEYLPAVPTFMLLLWYTLFCYVGGLLANILIACGRQKIDAWISFFLVIINISLNSILIPSLGFNGAAVATVIVEISGVVFILIYAMRSRDIRLVMPWRDAALILALNCLYAVILAFLFKVLNVHILLFIAGAVLLYGMMMVASGFVKVSSVSQYFKHWQKKGGA